MHVSEAFYVTNGVKQDGIFYHLHFLFCIWMTLQSSASVKTGYCGQTGWKCILTIWGMQMTYTTQKS